MKHFKTLIILINFIYYCNGCIRNLAAQVGPTITTGSMFPTVPGTMVTTTAMTTTTTTTCAPNSCLNLDADPSVIVTGPMGDASCVYTADLTCSDPTIEMLSFRFNIFLPNEILPAPQTVTCMAGSYYYVGVMGSTAMATVRCV